MNMDEDLLRNFSCMGTTDKEVLITQLQNLTGLQLTQQTACFYLDMANWNVQAAVCAYFDMQSGGRLPKMNLLSDKTVGEGESIQPSTKFTKTWCIQNGGMEPWPANCRLIFTGGEKLSAVDHIVAPPLGPGTITNVSIEMVSPAQAGTYSGKWRMSTCEGCYFGDTIWVILRVEQSGTLALLQQMDNLRDFGSQPSGPHLNPQNPFAVTQNQTSLPAVHNANNNNLDTEMS